MDHDTRKRNYTRLKGLDKEADLRRKATALQNQRLEGDRVDGNPVDVLVNFTPNNRLYGVRVHFRRDRAMRLMTLINDLLDEEALDCIAAADKLAAAVPSTATPPDGWEER